MTDDVNYQNHPLHGVSLKEMVAQLVDHYGFEILYAYLNINCFKTNPSVDSSAKFLKKTEWAREKVEGFYMYQYKSLPRASSTQFKIPHRDRIIPEHHQVGEPKELSIEDAQRLQEKKAEKAAEYNRGKSSGRGPKPRSGGSRAKAISSRSKSSGDSANSEDPWANWR